MKGHQLRQCLVERFIVSWRVGRKPIAEVDVDNVERAVLPGSRPRDRVRIPDKPEVIGNHFGLSIDVWQPTYFVKRDIQLDVCGITVLGLCVESKKGELYRELDRRS